MKRFIAAVFSLVLALGLAVPAQATTPRKIKSIHPEFAEQLVHLELDGAPVARENLTYLEVDPGSELRVYLFGENAGPLFLDQEGMPIPTADITLARLFAAQVQPSVQGDGREVVEQVEIVNGYTGVLPYAVPCIAVRFSDRLTGVEDAPFSLALSLNLEGAPLGASNLEIRGAVCPEQIHLTEETAAVSIQGGAVLVADLDATADISVGEGVVITANLEQGGKYAAKARSETEMLQDASGQAAGTVQVYFVDSVHFDPSMCTVRIESAQLLQVYDASGVHLGTTADALRLSGTYYVTDRTSFSPGMR